MGVDNMAVPPVQVPADTRIQSLRGLRALVVVLLGVAVVVWFLLLMPANALFASLTVTPDAYEYQAAVWALTEAMWLEMAAFTAALIALLVFVRRAWGNLTAFGVRDLEWSTTDVVGMWLVVGPNLVRIPKLMQRLVAGSRAAARGGTDWRDEGPSRRVTAWWAAYLLGLALYVAGMTLSGVAQSWWWLGVLGDASFITAGVLLMTVVAVVGRDQDKAAVGRAPSPAASSDGPSAPTGAPTAP